MTPATAMSYAHGRARPAARRDTIGENLRRDRRALRRARGARRPPPGLPRDLPRAVGAGRPARRAALLARGVRKGDRVGIWSPNRYEWVVMQFATARIGAILVNINPAYKTAELEYALNKSGVSLLVLARGLPPDRLRRDARRVRASCPALRERRARRRLGRVPRRRRRASPTPRLPSARRRCSSTTRSTSSTRRARPASRRARRSRTTTSSTTRTSSARRCATPSTTACASRCRSTTASAWCSATSPAPRHGACIVVPGESFDAAAVLETVAGRALHLALRRADDVHRRARPRRLRRVRSLEPAHRHHGRRALPGRGHEAGAIADAHARGHHLLRHDRDLAGLDPDGARRPAREARRAPSAACTRTWRSRSSTRPPAPSCRAATPGELCTRGYSVMLGYWNDDDGDRAARSTPRLDAHRRPRDRWTTTATSTSSAASRT